MAFENIQAIASTYIACFDIETKLVTIFTINNWAVCHTTLGTLWYPEP